MVRNDVKRLLEYKELLINLSIKELKVRYKTLSLGFLWAILNPLLMMIILTIIFSILIKIEVENYSIFLLCALLPWTFFNFSLTTATSSIQENRDLIKKVFFPREIIPISVVLANLVNFIISLTLLLLFLIFFKIKISPMILLLPLIIFFQFIFTIGICLFTSALNVYYRDIKYIVQLLLIIWFYASPVIYPFYFVFKLPKILYSIYLLNPLAGLFNAYRDILIGSSFSHLDSLIIAVIESLLVFLLSFSVFRKLEPNMADVV